MLRHIGAGWRENSILSMDILAAKAFIGKPQQSNSK